MLRFGGEVMKNVAGYDVSRLMTGAWGTLGVLLEVSLKVLPRPAAVRTLASRHDRGGSDRAVQCLGREAASRHRRMPRWRAASRAARGHRGRGRVGGGCTRRRGHRRRCILDGAPRADVAVLHPDRPPAVASVGSARRDRGGSRRRHPLSTGAVRCDGCAPRRPRPRSVPPHRAPAGTPCAFAAGTAPVRCSTPSLRPLGGSTNASKAAFDPAGIFNPGRMYEGI